MGVVYQSSCAMWTRPSFVVEDLVVFRLLGQSNVCIECLCQICLIRSQAQYCVWWKHEDVVIVSRNAMRRDQPPRAEVTLAVSAVRPSSGTTNREFVARSDHISLATYIQDGF